MTTDRRDNSRHIKARTGATLVAKSWQTEAAVRMLMNNLDEHVAEDPQTLTVYGGIGRAARNWACYDKIVETLERLDDDETLLVQSGKPVGVFRTHADAPRVLIANPTSSPNGRRGRSSTNSIAPGLMMYGQMTAGCWIYIGTQGIVQGTFETFAEMGRQHYGGDLAGKWILTAGLGGMGGAQPLAAVMAGAHCIAVEVQESRSRSASPRATSTIAPPASTKRSTSCAAKVPTSVGLLGNAAEILPEMVARGIRPDAVTDQTSAHDPANGYCPAGWSVAEWIAKRETRPRRRRRRRAPVDGAPRRGDARLQGHGHPDLRLWQQHPPGSARHRRRPRLRLPRLRPRLRPAPCSAAASARSAGSR